MKFEIRDIFLYAIIIPKKIFYSQTEIYIHIWYEKCENGKTNSLGQEKGFDRTGANHKLLVGATSLITCK